MIENPIDPKFADTFFVVEANSFEQHMLWLQNATDAADLCRRPREPKRYLWVQDNSGPVITIGELDGYPVNIACLWATIGGRRVLFYFGSSVVVHLHMIDRWMTDHCCPRWDGGSRRAHCDASNFHHCLGAIDDDNYLDENLELVKKMGFRG